MPSTMAYEKSDGPAQTSLKLETAADDIRNTRYHIVSGNGKVRRSASDFRGINYSESPLAANWLERLVARFAVQPLNRSLGVTQDAKSR